MRTAEAWFKSRPRSSSAPPAHKPDPPCRQATATNIKVIDKVVDMIMEDLEYDPEIEHILLCGCAPSQSATSESSDDLEVEDHVLGRRAQTADSAFHGVEEANNSSRRRSHSAPPALGDVIEEDKPVVSVTELTMSEQDFEVLQTMFQRLQSELAVAIAYDFAHNPYRNVLRDRVFHIPVRLHEGTSREWLLGIIDDLMREIRRYAFYKFEDEDLRSIIHKMKTGLCPLPNTPETSSEPDSNNGTYNASYPEVDHRAVAGSDDGKMSEDGKVSEEEVELGRGFRDEYMLERRPPVKDWIPRDLRDYSFPDDNISISRTSVASSNPPPSPEYLEFPVHLIDQPLGTNYSQILGKENVKQSALKSKLAEYQPQHPARLDLISAVISADGSFISGSSERLDPEPVWNFPCYGELPAEDTRPVEAQDRNQAVEQWIDHVARVLGKQPVTTALPPIDETLDWWEREWDELSTPSPRNMSAIQSVSSSFEAEWGWAPFKESKLIDGEDDDGSVADPASLELPASVCGYLSEDGDSSRLSWPDVEYQLSENFNGLLTPKWNGSDM